MNQNTEKILEDLYNIDSSFRKHEKELKKIINKVLLSKPDIKMDKNFVEKLRQEVLAKAETFTSQGKKIRLFNFMNINKFAYAGIGAFLMLIIILPALFLTRQSTSIPFAMKDSAIDLSETAKIAKLENNAFGSLASQDDPALTQVDGRGAGGATAMLSASQAISEESNVKMTEDMAASTERMIMPRPDFVNYEYSYEGEAIELPKSTIAVYQRSRNNDLAKSYANSVSGINFGLLDISQFKNTEAISLNIAEDREFGYTLYFNFNDNSMSINSNWEKWPRVGAECRDSACHEKYRLRESDVPSDAELIDIANKFLRNYGINTTNHGEPYVNRQWERNIGIREAELYIPENIPVVYPSKIEDRLTYDESGNATGMTVDVNIRYNKVANSYGIFKPDFNRSDYEAETDSDRIIKFAENGGLWTNYLRDDASKTVTLKLGTPELHLVRHWHYVSGQEKGSSELYVEALFFPITNLDELDQPFHREYVVVPLAKEILDSRSEEPVFGIPEPMPLLRTDSVEAPSVTPELPLIKEVESK
jgi:hypothetical protein